MAITERYVTSGAAGGGDGSIGSPWTIIEAFANAVAGDRVNIQSDATYSVAANLALTNDGTISAPVIFRGYSSAIGDAYIGRNAAGELITTNMPEITFTSTNRISDAGQYSIYEGLNITGAYPFGNTVQPGNDNYYIHCKMVGTADNASARTIALDGRCSAINCDISSTGASTAGAVNLGAGSRIVGSRCSSTNGSAIRASTSGGSIIIGCTVHDSLEGIEVSGATSSPTVVVNCTGYNITNAFVTLPSAATPDDGLIIINCHVTDCGQFAANDYSGTTAVPVMRINCRTRDNTLADVGFGDWPIIDGITTDTGDAATDYVDAASGNFNLISAAPGYQAGMLPNTNVGAWQSAAGGGGGTNVLITPGSGRFGIQES